MLTQTAKNDLAALRASGFNPTDEEIVQLNDLALKIERGKETTPANMPRVAFAGNVVLHEPTIGGIQWWNDFGRDASLSNQWRMFTYLFMLANAKNLELLDGLQTPKQINKAVKKWMKTVDATEDELWRALLYVKFGYEEPEVKDEDADENLCDRLWEIVCMTAGMMNVTPESLRTQTQSTLVKCLEKSSIKAHLPMKRSVAEDYIKYRQLLRKIEERGGTDNG